MSFSGGSSLFVRITRPLDECHITDIGRLDHDCKCIIHRPVYLFQCHIIPWGLYGRLCRSCNDYGVHAWQHSDSWKNILDCMDWDNKYSVLKSVLFKCKEVERDMHC